MSGGKVLIVEDSLVVRASLRSRLQSLGCEVIEAEEGAGALVAARETLPDVVLLDVELPGLDGYAVLEQLKQDEQLAAIPVVFLTGRTSADELVRALSLGAHDYLRKPFEEAELIARVQAALRVKGLQDQLRLRVGELAEAARIDSLTGLYNRRHLDELLAAAASHARRHQHTLGVVLADIDHFKQINDGLGHAAGDLVIVDLAERLKRAVRAEDSVGRWGGEEFLVLVPETSLEGTQILAERLRLVAAAEPFMLSGEQRLDVTISVGCTTSHGDEPDAVLARVDRAMYAAKTAGRNRVGCLCHDNRDTPLIVDYR